MIVSFHPKEIESKKGAEIIARLNASGSEQVIHVTDKTADEWRAIIAGPEKLVFVTPMYWWGAGYEFDKWVQMVFTYGFAYKYADNGMPEGLLNGREFEMHMTHGTPAAFAAPEQENVKMRMTKGIFGFCNAKITMSFYDMTA